MDKVNHMVTVPAQEIKRRGISAVDPWLAQGPVHIIRNNQPRYVVIGEEEYALMIADLASARIAASERDLAAGHFKRGSADVLLAEIAASDNKP